MQSDTPLYPNDTLAMWDYLVSLALPDGVEHRIIAVARSVLEMRLHGYLELHAEVERLQKLEALAHAVIQTHADLVAFGDIDGE